MQHRHLTRDVKKLFRVVGAATAVITGIIGVLMMPWKLLGDFSSYIFGWLVGYSGLLGPIAGIMIVDYFLVRRKQLEVEDLPGPGSVFLLEQTEIIGVIIMIANRNREHLLSLVLFNYKAVEMRFDVARQKIKNKLFTARFRRRRLFARGSRLRLGKSRDRDMISEV